MTVAIGCSPLRSLFSLLLLQGDKKPWELFIAYTERARWYSVSYFSQKTPLCWQQNTLQKHVSLKNIFFRICEEKNLWEQCQYVQIFFSIIIIIFHDEICKLSYFKLSIRTNHFKWDEKSNFCEISFFGGCFVVALACNELPLTPHWQWNFLWRTSSDLCCLLWKTFYMSRFVEIGSNAVSVWH